MLKTMQPLSKLLCLFTLMWLITTVSQPAQAQESPFSLEITPSLAEGKITYTLDVRREVDWTVRDLRINILLPAGTRFLEAGADPVTTVNFSGTEVSFFTAVFNRPLRTNYFIVEVTDPTLTEFTTKAWVSWQGEQVGQYWTDDIVLDTTLKPLNWKRPPRLDLQLETKATVADNIITYNLYPTNTGSRMWDLRINVPIPVGTTFLSVEAPPAFTSEFNGQEVSFLIIELPRSADFGPLRFKVSINKNTTTPIVTHAWATWKVSSDSAGVSEAAVQQFFTGDIIVQPAMFQQAVGDAIGDVPFTNYDLTSVSLQEEGDNLKATFYTADRLCPVDTPLQFTLFIDSDCQSNTGSSQRGLGVEYQIRYEFGDDIALVQGWNELEESWAQLAKVDVVNPVGQKNVTLSIPYELLQNTHQFCWVGRSRNTTDEFIPKPSADWLPDNTDFRLAQYKAISATSVINISASITPTATPRPVSAATCTQPSATPAPLANKENLKGKLAVPLYNDKGFYDVHIFSVPSGQEVISVANARQPDIRFDGQKMLVNREGGGIEDLYEYNLATGVQQKVSDAPEDAHPAYNPGGNRVTYDNPALIIGSGGSRSPFIFVQCSLLPPHEETEQRCKAIPTFGVLVPAGQTGEVQGRHPVWTDDDRIAFKGCNSWSGSTRCGLYVTPSSGTKGFSNGFNPTPITNHPSDIPADTKAGFVTFTSQRDGNWEAYIVNLDGSGLRNLSNSPTASDGLPTISPDGSWVAFISNRNGVWAVWVTPIGGGEVQKLFNLPDTIPWGVNEYDWMSESISWGP